MNKVQRSTNGHMMGQISAADTQAADTIVAQLFLQLSSFTTFYYYDVIRTKIIQLTLASQPRKAYYYYCSLHH